MRRARFWLVAVLGVISLLFAVAACGGGGGSTTPEAACSHYCSCSFASQIPNCQTTCVAGINMASNPSGCAQCTGDSSCTELENDACENACTF